MTTTQSLMRGFGEVGANVVGLDLTVTEPVCEGLNIALASFQALYLQYQKHHFVVEGAEFYSLHEFFEDGYEQLKSHAHDVAERLDGLGGVPAASFTKLAELCCFTPEADGAFNCRTMLEMTWWASKQLSHCSAVKPVKLKVWAIAQRSIYTNKFC